MVGRRPEGTLPWAGTWRGREGVARWFDALNAAMEYDRAEPFEWYAQGDTVIELFHGEGHAKPTGRPFKSDIARIYTMRRSRIVRVRNFYDTAAYVAALRDLPESPAQKRERSPRGRP
ncbi:MAG: nuclear transport factor 2 family protein [Candidatus Thermoplasmatota archaeon]